MLLPLEVILTHLLAPVLLLKKYAAKRAPSDVHSLLTFRTNFVAVAASASVGRITPKTTQIVQISSRMLRILIIFLCIEYLQCLLNTIER